MKNKRLYYADKQNGEYQNPILFADYSDPDVIRVGDTYYMVASSFNYVPGLPILTSHDLVNWELVNYALPNIPYARYEVPQHSQGVWAPAIRYRDDEFYIFVGMPDEGIFMLKTKDPLGQWSEPVCLLEGKGLIDPCPFWDEDGKAYVVHGFARSRIGFKSFLGIFPMTPDGTKAIGTDHLLYNGLETQPTIEGPKVHRRGEYLYIFAPAGGVETGWQTVLRAKDIHGPFEERVVMRQGTSSTNGPHQGAWIEDTSGKDWFVHFQSLGAYGRIVHLQPMRWTADGWPYIGMDSGDTEWGMPCDSYEKPYAACHCEPTSLLASDDFSSDKLALQWQFMGNWRSDFFSLTEREQSIRLFARRLPEGCEPILWQCPQAMTQKLVCPAFCASVVLDASGLNHGEQAGFALMGGQYAYVAMRKNAEGFTLVHAGSHGDAHTESVLESKNLRTAKLTLHMELQCVDGQPKVCFGYCVDGNAFVPLAKPFFPSRHTWVGAKPTLFVMSYDQCEGDVGHADFSQYQVIAMKE
ncbi:MAG: glycosyl hydrolase 43 family protein [Clostridiales bacterium]|nr:glycosyl hydrolase 43 family protein [Clostridiales bacterium]